MNRIVTAGMLQVGDYIVEDPSGRGGTVVAIHPGLTIVLGYNASVRWVHDVPADEVWMVP